MAPGVRHWGAGIFAHRPIFTQWRKDAKDLFNAKTLRG
jgi:hypothetical protein